MSEGLTDFDHRAIYYLAHRELGKRAIDAHKEAKMMFNKSKRNPIAHILLPGALAIYLTIRSIAQNACSVL